METVIVSTRKRIIPSTGLNTTGTSGISNGNAAFSAWQPVARMAFPFAA